MKLERFKRWQWMIVGLVIGLVIAYIRQMYTDDVLGDYGNTMTSNALFEQSLVNEYKGVRLFKDLVVYPIKIDGKPRHIVAGKFYSGRPERQPNGKVAAVWRPHAFVAKPLYRPFMKLETLNKTGGPDYALRWKSIENPTVIDFLTIMKEAKGINFRYAWWAEPKKAYIIWMITGVVVIGGIWPFLVNLIAFGSLKAPPEEKGIDLRKVKPTNTKSEEVKMPKSAVTNADLDAVEALTGALEEKLAGAFSETPAASEGAAAAAVAAGPAPIKELTATKMETAGPLNDHKDDKSFGASSDDFYPTERKAKPNKPA